MLSVPILALHADPDTQPRLESSFWPHGVLWHKVLESNQPQQLSSSWRIQSLSDHFWFSEAESPIANEMNL